MDEDVLLMMQKLIDKYNCDDSSMYISTEFFNLKDYSNEISYIDDFKSYCGALDCNAYKNRYKDILPFDKTRVILDKIDNIEGSDYINASFIKGVDGSYSYIASQGPLKSTVSDFMRMLWQFNINVLVCACNEYEGHKMKCYRYWLNDTSEILNFGKIEAKLIESETDSSKEFIRRDILLKKTEIINDKEIVEERTITQFHMINWPDHGIPDNLEPIINMLDLARSNLDKNPLKNHEKYLLVHCSAGCGRTGTIIAVDYCWNLLQSRKLTSDFTPFKIAKQLREQRTAMIQTFEQYKMFYEALRYLFTNYLSLSSIKSNKENQSAECDFNNNSYQNSSQYERGQSGSKKSGSIKSKIIDKIRPSSSASLKIQNSSATFKTPTVSSAKLSSSFKGGKSSSSDFITNSNNSNINNLPKLYKDKDSTPSDTNNNFYDNSNDNFEFKPIPFERFTNQIQIGDSKQNLDDTIDNVDDYDEDDEDDGRNLVSNSVGGVADSIFGLRSSSGSIKLKRDNSFKQLRIGDEDDDLKKLNNRNKQSMSASFASGSIKKHVAAFTDLKQPMKAQISNDVTNPSPPVSVRSSYELKFMENDNNTYTPVPPPRNKSKSKSNLNDSVNIIDNINRFERTNTNDTYSKQVYLNENNNNNNKNTQFISKTEHFV